MSERSIGTIVLAAGESSRLGQPKQLLPYRGATLVQNAAAAALKLQRGPVAVVLGAFAEDIRAVLVGLPIHLVKNADWHEGMGTSVHAGLRALRDAEPDLAAVLILLCDQPLIDTAALESLIAAYGASGCKIAAAEYCATLGVPALFDAALFPALLALPATAGARQLIHEYTGEIARVPLPVAALDIDTAADVAALAAR